MINQQMQQLFQVPPVQQAPTPPLSFLPPAPAPELMTPQPPPQAQKQGGGSSDMIKMIIQAMAGGG